MTFRKIEPEKLSQSVIRQIEDLILRGVLRPGERLPSERDLAERLGVSRPSLRDAVASLSARGLLVSRANSGIYVAEVLGSAFSPALMQLFASNDDAVFDYIAFRRDIEALAADRAARMASDTDLAVIDTLHQRMLEAHKLRDPTLEAQLDAEFHLSIMEASHNVIMLHMMRSMFDLLQQGVFYNRQSMFRQRANREGLLAQHTQINAGLQARDPDAARSAVIAHLDFVEAMLRDRQRAEANERTAEQRLAHERERAARVK
ncbi:GntR family transcriptional regulator [Meridianimarinicoccus roseus]|jgi:GntR family transcriptional repressor for pyruvate dehydrogenase complex|uniref:Pyruvate dehydrogenase complex repressor n=1 Tax=Meridianimarinicoccus roseus TaxID=2072018 RepID=A0A2V2L8F2_9RHOB|nr:FadR/GntR family transcriptional regulator [Meridianimarinicoccus roseus]PWR01582.1 GntR family transcriptional regulator [Meridianimarinicoccus roseus]